MVWACAAKKEENDWVKKRMEFEVEGDRSKGKTSKQK